MADIERCAQCGAPVQEVRGKAICTGCGRICEGCCEGAAQAAVAPDVRGPRA
jgi:hypothetical protein